MRVEAWSVAPVRHLNLDPDWHYAGRDVPVLPGLRIALRAGNEMGEGYAPFLPHLDASTDVLEESGRAIAQDLLGADLSEFEACLALLGPCVRSRNASRSAAEMSLLDLAARLNGTSVAILLGGEPRPIDVLRIIPVKAPDRMAAIAGALVEEGYRALKLKAAGDHEADFDRISAVRTAVGPDVRLTVDANQAYTTEGALRLEAMLRPSDIWSLEQPVPATDRSGLAQVRRKSKVRIEADEGLFDASDLEVLLGARAADGISLKLARSGGLLPSLNMGRKAAGQGVYSRLGTAFGGPLLALATSTIAALAPTEGPAECAEFTHFDDAEHLFPTILDGKLMPSDGPGFGQERQTGWTAPWEG